MTTDLIKVIELSEQLSHEDQQRLLLWLQARLSPTPTTPSQPIKLLDTAGLGAEIWQGLDSSAYLEQERAAWTR